VSGFFAAGFSVAWSPAGAAVALLDLGLALADFVVFEDSDFAVDFTGSADGADCVDPTDGADFTSSADEADFTETADGADLLDFVALDSATAREIRPRRVMVAVRLRIVFMS
jgi:hypothetical protein